MREESKVKGNSLGGRQNLRKSAEQKEKPSQIRVKLILLSARGKTIAWGKTDGKSDVKIEEKK